RQFLITMYRIIYVIVLTIMLSGCGGETRQPGDMNNGTDVGVNSPAAVKGTAVAGAFYPDDPDELDEMIDGFIETAEVEPLPNNGLFAIFVPHAGYVYSGASAAYAYKAASLQTPETIILLSPSHYEYFDGVAYPDYDELATPLGNVIVDNEAIKAIEAECGVCIEDNVPFAEEHGIEVQLPFIKKTWPDIKIAPFIFGNVERGIADDFAKGLAAFAEKRDDILVVATCDLSHYHPYAEAVELDKAFFDAFESGNPGAIFAANDGGKCEIDAPGVVYAALTAGEALGYTDTKILDERNSGDVTGDRERVVGYWAAVLAK
ncbi:MAG: AmmeMemoRadiSam system protein B, partial [bacterium]|nr:AmmeMemoRadiSam system protein B [bacterium]